MASKKQYNSLDDIGFIGTQKKRTAAQVKKDIEKTTQIIKNRKSATINAGRKKRARPLSNAK